MPCALEVAEQRACAERCEAELRRLRAEHAAEVESAAGEVPHSDSSGSEGEAALSAAVAEMRMRATGRVAPPPLAALLRVAAPRLPAPAAFTAQYARAAAAASPAAAESLTRRVSTDFDNECVFLIIVRYMYVVSDAETDTGRRGRRRRLE